jgi:hypothetical protein
MLRLVKEKAPASRATPGQDSNDHSECRGTLRPPSWHNFPDLGELGLVDLPKDLSELSQQRIQDLVPVGLRAPSIEASRESAIGCPHAQTHDSRGPSRCGRQAVALVRQARHREHDAAAILLLLAGQLLRATRHGEPALWRAIGQACQTLRQEAKEDVL